MNFVTCSCSHCGGHLEFDDDHDGEQIACPHCWQKTILKSPLPKSLPSPLAPCPDCGHQVSKRAAACPNCGAPIASVPSIPPPAPPPTLPPRQYPAPVTYVVAARSRGIYIILGLFLGALGIHNFYAGRHGIGATQLVLTACTFWMILPVMVIWVWSLIEICTVTTDGQGRALA